MAMINPVVLVHAPSQMPPNPHSARSNDAVDTDLHVSEAHAMLLLGNRFAPATPSHNVFRWSDLKINQF